MFISLFKSLRPRQWTKNAFVFAALVFDQQLTNIDSSMRILAGAGLFCILSSCVYIFNDIADVEADRKHPKKCKRPIASGALPVPVALWAAIVMLAITFPLAYLLSPLYAVIALFYFLLNLAYSNWLKHIPLLDVLVLASGFVLRVGAGVSLIHVQRFSPWLYVVTMLLALFIVLGKRRAELNLLAEGANEHRRVLGGYTIPFLDQLITIVTAATIMAYSLYTFSAPNLPQNHLMMLTIPFVLFALFRWLYLIQVKHEGGAPEDLVLSDRPLQITALLYGLSVLAIFYFIK